MPLAGLRLGVPKQFVMDDLEPVVAKAFERACKALSAKGVKIEQIDLPQLNELASVNAKGGFAASEKKVLHYRRHIETCDPVGAFVNDKVLTVNFLSCCEDGDLGRRNGLKVASMFSYMAAQLLSAKEVLPTHSYPSEGLLPALRRE